jgi:hypothetical protein
VPGPGILGARISQTGNELQTDPDQASSAASPAAASSALCPVTVMTVKFTS